MKIILQCEDPYHFCFSLEKQPLSKFSRFLSFELELLSKLYIHNKMPRHKESSGLNIIQAKKNVFFPISS